MRELQSIDQSSISLSIWQHYTVTGGSMLNVNSKSNELRVFVIKSWTEEWGYCILLNKETRYTAEQGDHKIKGTQGLWCPAGPQKQAQIVISGRKAMVGISTHAVHILTKEELGSLMKSFPFPSEPHLEMFLIENCYLICCLEFHNNLLGFGLGSGQNFRVLFEVVLSTFLPLRTRHLCQMVFRLPVTIETKILMDSEKPRRWSVSCSISYSAKI